MKILVTGYKGFIGQNLLESEYFSGNDFTLVEKDEEFPNIKGFDWVIHLGAISATTGRIEDVMKYNYEYSMMVYDECVKHGVNLQWASSASVYGTSTSFKESDDPDPRSPYSWSKYLMERYIDMNPSNIIVQGFRYFNVYGPHEDHKGNMASPYHKFEKQLEESGVISLFDGSNKSIRDFINVDQVLKLQADLMDKAVCGVFNIGTGSPKSFLDVANELLVKYPKGKVVYIPMPENIKKNYQAYTCADMNKVRGIL